MSDEKKYLVEIHEEIVHQLVVSGKDAKDAYVKAKQLINNVEPEDLAKDLDLNYSIESEGLTGTWSTQPWKDANN